MRMSGLLHARLSAVLTELGHTDVLVVADAGLPIPPGVERIDLALVPGVPGFLQTLEAILAELAVESAIVAEEMADRIGIIHQGRLIAAGTWEQLRQQSGASGHLEDVFLALTAPEAPQTNGNT